MKATALRPWLDWYDSARWRKISRQQKAEHPLCEMCLAKGAVIAAEVADHVVPHRGDYQLFWFGDLQSLCWSCHSREKQQMEVRGYTNNIGLDGWPTDPKNPANAIESAK